MYFKGAGPCPSAITFRKAVLLQRDARGHWSPYLLYWCHGCTSNRLWSAKLSWSYALIKNDRAFLTFKNSNGKDFTWREQQEPSWPDPCPLAWYPWRWADHLIQQHFVKVMRTLENFSVDLHWGECFLSAAYLTCFFTYSRLTYGRFCKDPGGLRSIVIKKYCGDLECSKGGVWNQWGEMEHLICGIRISGRHLEKIKLGCLCWNKF